MLEEVVDTNKTIHYFYLLVDNDVGGQGFDLNEEWNVKRFNRHLDEFDVSTVNFVDFIKLH